VTWFGLATDPLLMISVGLPAPGGSAGTWLSIINVECSMLVVNVAYQNPAKHVTSSSLNSPFCLGVT